MLFGVLSTSFVCSRVGLLPGSNRRLFTTSIVLRKKKKANVRIRLPPPIIVAPPSAQRQAGRKALANANRARWEAQNALLSELAGKHPTSDVYMVAHFEPKRYSLEQAVEALREGAQPEMYDCLQNALIAKLVLNMSTKKKTKFVAKFEDHIVPPVPLDFLPKKRVLAFCKSPEDAAACLEAGALDAGTEDLLVRLQHGTYHWEAFDVVVAHPVWEPALRKLNHVLKDRTPSVRNNQIGENLPALVEEFRNGVNFVSHSLQGVPEVASLTLVVGQLAWDVQDLDVNLRSYLERIVKRKSTRIVGDFISSVELSCPPTGEQFLLDHHPLMPELEEKVVEAEEC